MGGYTLFADIWTHDNDSSLSNFIWFNMIVADF